MGDLVIRNLDEATAARLSRQAAEHGRSVEDEVREILAKTVRLHEHGHAATSNAEPEPRGIGTAIHQLFAQCGGLDTQLPERGEMRLPDFE